MKSVGTKFAIEIAVVLLLAMTFFGIYEVYQQKAKYTDFLDEREDITLKPLSLILGELLFDLERSRIDNVIHSYLNAPDVLAIKILENEQPSHYWGKTSETSHEIVNILQEEIKPPTYENTVIKTRPLLYSEQQLGTLEVVFSRQFVLAEIQETIIKVSQSFLLVIILEVLVVLSLAHKNITVPLRRLTDIASRIADGEVDIDLPKMRSRDEIGSFTKAFQRMIRSIQHITETAINISTGDLRSTVQPRSSKDALGLAFQSMSTYLKDMASVATDIAQGDLRREIQPRTEHDVLGMAFQNMKTLRNSVQQVVSESNQLRSASENLTQISTNMASNAEEASNQVRAVSSNSQQINQNVNEISTAIEELAASIREISKNVAEVMTIITAAVDRADTATTTIANLETHSQEIGQIIKVITTITQQTNLLALNATIEAARAGESGKGFAVVAGEVKELSRGITSSAEDVTRRVTTIQSSTSEVVSAITEISAIIKDVSEIANSITAAIEEQALTAKEVSQNIFHAAKGSDEITSAMNDVTTTVEESSQQAVMVQSAAEMLVELADQLQHVTETFKI